MGFKWGMTQGKNHVHGFKNNIVNFISVQILINEKEDQINTYPIKSNNKGENTFHYLIVDSISMIFTSFHS